ncbi:MAG: LysR family transcriptional regulator [Lautropia sp.]
MARQGSLRHAAARLFVAQSALSRHVVALEDELGTALFERHARGMTLTAAGRLFLAYADETHARLDEVRARIEEFEKLRRGHVDIACVEGLLSGLLPEFVEHYTERHDAITLSISALGSTAVAEAVAEHRVDLGIVFGQSPRSDLIELARMIQPLCAIVAPGHPLARQSSCRLAELQSYRVVLPNRSFGIRQLIDRVSAQGRFEMRMAIETNTLAFAWRLALQNTCLTFLPMDTVRAEVAQRRLIAVPLTDPLLRSTRVTLVESASRRRSAATESVVSVLRERMAARPRGRGRGRQTGSQAKP